MGGTKQSEEKRKCDEIKELDINIMPPTITTLS
jgi:hypothetical protein